MKKVFLFLSLLLLLNVSFCEEAAVTEVIGVSSGSIGTDIAYRGDSCTLSPESINAVKDFIVEELNTGNLSYSNVTGSYCYNYDDYNSISVTVLFKEDESSITGKSVTANFYSQTTYDYNQVFTSEELDRLGYNLKDKYMKYLVNGTSEEFYVILYSYNDCTSLTEYYNSVSDEKYFNEDSCSMVFKTRTSEIKSISSAPADYISYLGDSINFVFSGYSEGEWDLGTVSESIDCEVNTRYSIAESDSDCYAYYNDDNRLYFSSSKNLGKEAYAYFSVYGIIGGKVEFSVSVNDNSISESSVQSWVNELMNDYFPDYELNVDLEGEDYYKYLSKTESDFVFDTSVLSGFEMEENEMNTVYSKGDTYATITKPYIQVYFYDYPVFSSASVMPYWGNYFVITSNKVFARIVLDENNEELASQSLTELVSDYVSVNDWVLELNVGGGWYYPYPLMDTAMEGGGLAVSSIPEVDSAVSSGNNELLNKLQSETSGNLGSMNASKFEELESSTQKGVFESVWDYLTGLFK